MPSRVTLGISSHTELTIMVTLGMVMNEITNECTFLNLNHVNQVRNVMNLFSFTWTGNVQKIWDLPGPEPSFTAKYHFDYWLKNVLSLVVLFRNFTTHLHLVLYIVMLYPLLTGERPRLMMPWLYLQMLKNIVTDVICTVVGVVLCWTLHSCGLMLLEFLIVRVISMMPSIYLWRRLRSYYFDLYYAELDADYSYPMVKANHPTLAQRRRASKSIDGTVRSEDSQPRMTSCTTYDEIFGPRNWEEDEEKVTKSLTTLLTMESEESDDESLTPAEKTLRILGLTRDEVDGTIIQLHKITSTIDDVADHESLDVDLRSSLFSVAEESLGIRTVGMRVLLAEGSRTKTADVSEERRTQCTCCEGIKCSKEEESDSEEEDETLGERKSVDCCDKTRDIRVKLDEPKDSDKKEKDAPNAHVALLQREQDSETISPPSGCQEDNLHPGSYLQAVVKRDDIAWENLKEINFVSVISKALCNEIKPFKLQRNWVDDQKPKVEDSDESRLEWQSEKKSTEIIPEREDGTKFISRPQTSWDFDSLAYSVPTSASFGVDSDILALNASRDFEKTSISGAQSFDSTALIRPDHDISDQSYFESSFQRHSNMFDDSRAKLDYDPWDFGREKCSRNEITTDDAVLKPSRDSEVTLKSQRINSGEKYLSGGTKDRRFLASSSRSSRTRETAEEREAKTMQALKAYNEKTLLRYKTEMNEFRYPLSKRNRATSLCKDPYAPSVRGLETSEEELILNIENAYARLTRSKRPDSNFDVVTENRSTKEFFEIYSGVTGKEKKYYENKLNDDKKGTRKQLKRNESDVTSMSCKIIEGKQKGRELDRTVAMENMTVEQNVQQVYYFDQQVNDRPSTSKNPPITTIKSFSRQLNDDNVLGTVSSEVLTSMVEVLNNPEEIPSRIEDTEYYRQLRKNNSPKNVQDAVNNIDWSFQRPSHVDNHSNKVCNTAVEVVRAETNPRQNIVEKTTEKMLEIAFANSENSERGFRLGESDDEYYPIFNTFAVAMEEIVRAAGRRGYTDEYGLAGCESTGRSSLRSVLTEDIRALKKLSKKEEPIPVTTTTASGSLNKKLDALVIRREDSLDRDETVSIHANEEGTSVLNNLIASEVSESAEINVPVIGSEDIPERSEDVGKVQRTDVTSCRRILERFDTGGTELQGMIAKVFDHFDSSGGISFPNGSLRGSDRIAGLQIVSNLYEIRNTVGEIMSAEGETSSRETGNSSLEDNEYSGSRSTSGTSGATNFENVTVQNTSTGSNNPVFGRGKRDRDNEENNLNRRVVRPSLDKISEPEKLLSSISDADSVSPTHSEVLRREDFRRLVINSGFVQAVQQGEKDTRVQTESCGANFEEPEDEMQKLLVKDDEPQNMIDDTDVLADFASNATPDAVLREIEIADDVIKRMKTVFEKFSKEKKQNRTESLKLDSKVSFLTNLRFPVDGELRKLQNLVQTVANYTMIIGSTSAQSIKLDRRKSSGVFEKVSETLQNTRVNSIPNDRLIGISVLKKPGPQGPAGSRDNMGSFSSWDKIIPLSTRRQLAKDRRQRKPKKTLAFREPPRRVVKVIRMIEKKESDFFSARSIPQRGRGLSSGYLMDSDSDGNFTVSRPPTPASIESTTSQNLSFTNEEPISQAPDQPIKPCSSSSSEIQIQGVKVDDQCAQNALRDGGLDVIDTTGNYLENMKSVDAAGIENNLKDVEQLILSHQFREVGPSTIEVQAVSKNTSLTTILVTARTDLQSTSCNPEQDFEVRVREKLSKAVETPVQHLNCRDSDSKSENSDAVPFDVARRKSRDSLKDVAIETESDTKVFKENETIPVINDQDDREPGTILNGSSSSESYRHESKEGVEVPNRFNMTSSYDSFISLFSQNNLVDFTEQSPQVTSISNHSHFEEFPDQVVSSLQSLGTACVADKASSESSKIEFRLQEEDVEEESRKESSYSSALTSTPGSSKVDANSGKGSKSKKRGIPRLIRGTKDQR